MNAVLQLARHKLTVEDYHRMGEAGILAPDSRVELIEGEIIDMAPIGSQHAGVVNLLTRFFVRAVGDAGLVSIQNPVRLSNDTEPQPDVLVLRPRSDDYRSRLPTAADVLLLIEVGDSSAAYDSRVKMPLYARHGIPEVWLFDLTAAQMEIYTLPGVAGYGQKRRLGREDVAAATLLPSVKLSLRDVWPA